MINQRVIKRGQDRVRGQREHDRLALRERALNTAKESSRRVELFIELGRTVYDLGITEDEIVELHKLSEKLKTEIKGEQKMKIRKGHEDR